MLRRKSVGFEGVETNGSAKITLSPSGERSLTTDAISHVRSRSRASSGRLQARMIRMVLRDSSTRPSAEMSCSTSQSGARAPSARLRERDGQQLRRMPVRTRRREPDLGSRWRPGQSVACQFFESSRLAPRLVDHRDHRLRRRVEQQRALEKRHMASVGRHPERPRGPRFMDGRPGGKLDGPGTRPRGHGRRPAHRFRESNRRPPLR